MLNAVVLAVTAGLLALFFHPRLNQRTGWRAMITPLASIIGSGFLVLGPVLGAAYGYLAPVVMAGLCAVAFAFGSAIRFNIERIDKTAGARSATENGIETLASAALAIAYVISVTYYLNLFGAFAVSLTEVDDAFHARLVTTATFGLILAIGWSRGFKALEGLEVITVSLKLAIIGGLLVGLVAFFARQYSAGSIVFTPPELSGWAAATTAFGLIITVQGFETSRYLGETYDARMRIRSMRKAQILSTAIYMIYILLIAYVFGRDVLRIDETAIIGIMRVVASVLPVLLVAGALAAQFSAAVADTAGAGGLFHDVSRGRVPVRAGYAALVAVGLVLTWAFDVFQIIAIASAAFALYYAIQAMIACLGARIEGRRWQAAAFAGLAMFGVVVLFTAKAVVA